MQVMPYFYCPFKVEEAFLLTAPGCHDKAVNCSWTCFTVKRKTPTVKHGTLLEHSKCLGLDCYSKDTDTHTNQSTNKSVHACLCLCLSVSGFCSVLLSPCIHTQSHALTHAHIYICICTCRPYAGLSSLGRIYQLDEQGRR